MATTATPPPSARAWPFVVSAGDPAYMWGGLGDTEPDAVHVYHLSTETWTRCHSRGPHPPTGLHNGGCTLSGGHLYLYGGFDGKAKQRGVLYGLDVETWTWRTLSDGDGAGGPGKKTGCRMVAHGDNLMVVGGRYGATPRSQQEGSSYEEVPLTGGVHTNEVHCYNLTTGLWSSPAMNGSRPPPCDRFSLTLIDDDQAVMFGGGTPAGKSSEMHVLHLPTMTWTLHIGRSGSWPEKRENHAAVCVGYGGQHKAVLISGGDGDDMRYGDIWLLELQSGRMEKLVLPERGQEQIQRCGHGVAELAVNSVYSEVMLFGGRTNSGLLAADTAILRLKLRRSTWSRSKRWNLKSIVDHTRLASPTRLKVKQEKIQSSTIKQQDVSDSEKRLEQQLEEYRHRAEELQKMVEESERKVQEFQKRAEDAEKRIKQEDNAQE